MLYLRSVSSICGVNVGSGPSSKVIATTLSDVQISQITFGNNTLSRSVTACGQQINMPTTLTTAVAVNAISGLIEHDPC